MAGSPGKVGGAVAELLVERQRIVRPGAAVLDLGCGAGALSIPLARRGSRMEGFSRGWCALTFAVGADPFPFRRMLWRSVMGTALPGRNLALQFLVNYLLCTQRAPALVIIERPVLLDVDLERAVDFYAAHFAIFGHEGTSVRRSVHRILTRQARGGRVRARGRSTTAVLWWRSGVDGIPRVR